MNAESRASWDIAKQVLRAHRKPAGYLGSASSYSDPGFPENLVLAILAGNYNDPEVWRVPVKVIVDIVLPVLTASD